MIANADYDYFKNRVIRTPLFNEIIDDEMKSICNDIGNIIFDFLSSNYPTLEFSLVYDTDFESEEPVIKILVKNQYLPLEQEIKILREIWDKVDEKYPNEFKRIQIILDYE